MNFDLPTLLVAATLLVSVLPDSNSARAQATGYQAASFFSSNMGTGGSPTAVPPLPASPLAGGLPAAGGNAYMDASGKEIVLPANYCPTCPGGYGNPGVGSYGDPMAVDFGGYGSDQCGPHYFDVSFGTVWLQGEDNFVGLVPFTSKGVQGAEKFLDPTTFGEYQPGWEIAARYDLGPLSVLEGTYMGLYDIGFKDQVLGQDVADDPDFPYVLESVFSDYLGTGTPIAGVDDGSLHRIQYDADLQSTELSYRRYWVGHHAGISGTYLLGARYFRFTDDFQFNSIGLVNISEQTATRLWSGENDLVGFQVGGDAWACVHQGLRIGCEGKAGIYNNRWHFRHLGTFSATPTAGYVVPDDFDVSTAGNQVAFATEGSANIVIDILPSWSIRGGYRVFYLNSLANAENNIDQSDISTVTVSSQGHALYHGFHGGLEYIW